MERDEILKTYDRADFERSTEYTLILGGAGSAPVTPAPGTGASIFESEGNRAIILDDNEVTPWGLAEALFAWGYAQYDNEENARLRKANGASLAGDIAEMETGSLLAEAWEAFGEEVVWGDTQ